MELNVHWRSRKTKHQLFKIAGYNITVIIGYTILLQITKLNKSLSRNKTKLQENQTK